VTKIEGDPNLITLDDLFTTQEQREGTRRENVVELPVEDLHEFRNHPFKVVDDDRMVDTAESIREYGVLVPGIVRPRPEGGYEIISGHRRKRGCELAGLDKMPVIIRDLDDDAATIIMVDSNLQRENILPSERAFAYQMKLEALRHQGERMDLTSRQLGAKLSSAAEVGQAGGDSRRQVQRYVRLTYLVPELLALVDSKKVAFTPAVEISFLKPEEQKLLLETMESEQTTPSLSQAQRLKKFSAEDRLDENVMLAIMTEEKGRPEQLTLPLSEVVKRAPKGYPVEKLPELIFRILEIYGPQIEAKLQAKKLEKRVQGAR